MNTGEPTTPLQWLHSASGSASRRHLPPVERGHRTRIRAETAGTSCSASASLGAAGFATTCLRKGQRPETFEFLGFKHVCVVDRRGRFTVIRIPSVKSCRKFLAKVHEWLLQHKHWSRREQQSHLRDMLRGFYQYFGLHHCAKKQGSEAVEDAPYGELVRYCDDFVVMCRTAKECEQAEARIRVILKRLGLELHPEKTRRVELYDGKEGFDFLGCHLHKRMSGRLWEQRRQRLYFLQRWPSHRSMKRVRQRVKELTPRSRCHADIRTVIDDMNPVLRGWGNYFRTGNAARQFGAIDDFVVRRLRILRRARKGRNVRPGEAKHWTREYFENLGLHRLRGTICYPEQPFWKGAA